MLIGFAVVFLNQLQYLHIFTWHIYSDEVKSVGGAHAPPPKTGHTMIMNGLIRTINPH